MCIRRTFTVYLWMCMWHTKWSLYIICTIKNTSVECIQPETPTQTHTCLPHCTCRSMVMLTLSPSDSACRWVFYILLKEILPVLLWRVLHLVKSHYYGNVRVLEIMARWEQLDCLWHNNPTLSISSASSHSHSLYCIYLHPPSLLYTLQFLSLTHPSCWSQSFFFPQHVCSKAILSFKSNIVSELSLWIHFNSIWEIVRLPNLQSFWKLYGSWL